MGPFTYQSHNPFSYKPGGFANGAGHGATYQDLFKQWWHISTIVISTKNNFERRIGIWPAQIDKDGILSTNTAYGDYPHYIPNAKADHETSQFTGWMLLNYNKPIRVSSTLGGFHANLANDENIKTYWSAKSGNKGEWIESDLGAVSKVNAIQINYADQDAETMGKVAGLYHQYKLYGTNNGKTWFVLIDKSNNKTDVPHEYVAFDKPVTTRFIKLENIHMPSGKFAISGLRVYGKTEGAVPDTVQHFVVLRGDTERMNSWLKWQVNEKATGYMIYTGTAPDKLYTSIMVLGNNEYYFSAMEKDQPYYFQIEPFNESGIGKRTKVVKVD